MRDNVIKCVFLILIVCVQSLALSQNISRINKIDSLGRKQGVWETRLSKHDVCVACYVDGVLEGDYSVIRDGKLTIKGQYHEGLVTGIWLVYDNTTESSHIVFRADGFRENKDFEYRFYFNGKEMIRKPDRVCRVTSYFASGRVRTQGYVAFYDEDGFLSDTAIEIGWWRYFDEQGRMHKKEFISYDNNGRQQRNNAR